MVRFGRVDWRRVQGNGNNALTSVLCLATGPLRLCFFSLFFFQLAIENFQKELSVLDERKQAVQAVQRLKQKQIALIMQSVADVQATVDEVRIAFRVLLSRKRCCAFFFFFSQQFHVFFLLIFSFLFLFFSYFLAFFYV